MEDFRQETNSKPGFSKGLILGLLGPLLVVGFFNLIIDPYRLSEDRIAGVNDAISPQNFLGESALVNAYKAYSKGDSAHISLIGTSHLAKGVPIVDKPHIEKIALGGLTLDEAFRIAQMIIDQSKVSKTILIELGSTRETKRGKPLNFQMRYLQAKTTRESIRLIRKSISVKDQKDKFVITTRFNKLPERAELLEQKDKLIAYLQLNRSKLDSLLSGLNTNDEKLKHRIIVFTSILPAQLVDIFGIRDLIESNHREISQIVADANTRTDHIEMVFVGMMDSSIGYEYLPWTESFHKGWYDFNHYKPVLGEQILEHLLRQAGTGE